MRCKRNGSGLDSDSDPDGDFDVERLSAAGA